MTLRRKLLLLLTVAASAPVVLAGLLSYRTSEAALKKAVDELHQRSAQAEAEYAEGYLRSLGESVASAMTSENPGSYSAREQEEFLNRVFLRHPGISVASLLGANEKVRASVFVDDPKAFSGQFAMHDAVTAQEAEDFYAKAKALLAKARTQHQPYVFSEPYFPSSRKKPVVALCAIANPPSSWALAIELNLNELDTHLASHTPPPSQAFVVDAQGAVLLSAAHGEKPPQSLGLSAERGAPVSRYVTSGREYLAAVSPIPQVGWAAVVARPEEEVLAPLRRLYQSNAAVLLLSLALVALTSFAGARAVSGPVAQLSEGAMQFAAGRFSHRIVTRRKDELGHLARTFNHMGERLEIANRQLLRFNEELQKQVDERTRELKLAQQQLLRSQRLAAIGDLSAGIAHEMNNPLAAIVGLVQLLLWEAAEGSKERGMLQDVHTQALRISEIVKDLQALSEAERGGMHAIDVRNLLTQVVSTKQEQLQTSGIIVAAEYDEQTSPVLGDEPSLRQVFTHLLNNSQTALEGRAQPRIGLTARSVEGQAVRIEVTDNGRGIPREHLERIFNPFFTTKQKWTGKGLALPICHRIIENHGGTISVQSEEGVGTTVTILLPAAPPSPHLT